MKYTNFTMIVDNPAGVSHATIDITTRCGFLWLDKKTETVEIAEIGAFWSFVETGKSTVGMSIERMCKLYRVKKRINIDKKMINQSIEDGFIEIN